MQFVEQLAKWQLRRGRNTTHFVVFVSQWLQVTVLTPARESEKRKSTIRQFVYVCVCVFV